jgi:hypothetical protein
MRVYGIHHILTLNDADFRRYPGIIAVHPNEVIKRESKPVEPEEGQEDV